MTQRARILTLGLLLLVNVWLLAIVAAESASGTLSTARGLIVLGAFVCEGLILYRAQNEFRGK